MIQEAKINWELLSVTRFILSFVVVVEHLTKYVNNTFTEIVSSLGAFEAILGFLLISGLSIGKSISRNKQSYFKRRLQRIYPVYFVSMVFSCLVLPGALTLSYAGFVALNLVFLNQVFTSTSLIGPAWTLALEVWLYALAPVLLKVSLKKLYILIYISFISYCVYTCGRTLYDWQYYAGTSWGINLILLSFIWILGFALAIYPEARKAICIHIALIFAAHLLLAIAIKTAYRYKHNELDLMFSEDLLPFLGRTISLLWVCFVVVYNHKVAAFKSGLSRLFTFLGNISYPLYLIHRGIYYQLHQWAVDHTLIMIGACILGSWLVYALFDSYSKKRVEKPKPELSSAITV